MPESYSVQAVLSAVDKNFSSVFDAAQKSLNGIAGPVQSATSAIQQIAAGIGGAANATLASSQSIQTAFSSVKAAVGDSVTQIMETVSTVSAHGSKLFDALKSSFDTLKGTFREKLDTAGLQRSMDAVAERSGKTRAQLEQDVRQIAGEYQKSGLSMTEAFQKAYADMDISSGNTLQKIGAALTSVIATGNTMLTVFLQAITANLPAVVSGGMQILGALITGLGSNMGALLPAAMGIVTTLLNAVLSAVPQMIVMGLTLLQSLAMGIIQNLPAIITSGVAMITALISGIGQMLPSILSAGWDIIVNLAQGILEAIPGILGAVIDGIKAIFSGLWGFITGKTAEGTAEVGAQVAAMSDAVTSGAESMAANATESTETMCGGIMDSFGGMYAGVSESASAMFGNVSGSLSGLDLSGAASMEHLADSVSNSASTANEAATADYDAMAEHIAATMEHMQSTAASGLHNLESIYRSSFTSIHGIVVAGAVGIVSAFGGLYSQLYSVGVYAMSGLQGGLNAMRGAVLATAASIANQVAATIRNALKVGSPSRVLMRIGEFAGEGLEIGLLHLLSDVERAGEKLAQAATPVAAADFAGVQRSHAAGLPRACGTAAGELPSHNSYSRDAEYTIVVPLSVDGREFARATAGYTQAELDRQQTRVNRRHGKG